jgi:hypothetical protein
VRRTALAGLAALALGGCASATSYDAPLTVVRASSVDVGTTPDCVKGNQACIDSVVAEMDRRYLKLAAACDHRAPFALMYMRVTEGVKRPAAGRFHDQNYLRRLDAQFARLYFRAFDSYQAGRPADGAWQIAFDSARSGQTTGIGDMLLGMNAHISNDLPFALLAAGLKERDGRSAQADFDSVNNLLGDVQAPMIKEESRLFEPGIAGATLPYLGVHGGELATVIAGWRTEAWQNAEQMLAATGAFGRAKIALRIRAAAAQRAQVIQALASNRLLGGDAKLRDAYCRTRGAGAHPPG